MNLETLQVLTRWFERTEYILRLEKKKFDVDDTLQLDQSMFNEVRQKANDLLEGELEFLVRGRFVDMGAGRKAKVLESRETNGQLLNKKKRKIRKPKKWYSKAFYGRLNDLQGVLGFKLMEAAIDSVKNPMELRSTGTIGRPRL
jgi:hypothetical protein